MAPERRLDPHRPEPRLSEVLVNEQPAYQKACDRVRAEYLEMPGMRLTPQQVQRLMGLEAALCRHVLDVLVGHDFLRLGHDGRYGRSPESVLAKPRPVKAELALVAVSMLTQRAS